MGVQPMTDRERILAVIEGRLPDRIPWIPRLQIWYDAHLQRGDLPARYQGWDLRRIEQDLGMGTPAREGRVFRAELEGVDVRAERTGADTVTTYTTPVGSVTTVSRGSSTLSEGGIAGALLVKHMITGPDDYPVVEEIIRRTRIIPTYADYLAYDAQVGDAGLPLVAMGPDPMYRIIQDLVGYNNVFYHLHDDRARVMHLYDVLEEQAQEIQQVVLDSPATLILHGEHFDSQFTPPRIFRSTMLPYFQTFADRLHARGKVMVCHADADTSHLLGLIKEAGFDMAECFVTAPMVPVTLAEARAAFGDQVIIWGGVPSSILCDPVSDAAFTDYMRDLFQTIAPGHAFILGVADNVMAEAKFDRIERISEMVATLGNCPIPG
jgi:hypothetical protein